MSRPQSCKKESKRRGDDANFTRMIRSWLIYPLPVFPLMFRIPQCAGFTSGIGSGVTANGEEPSSSLATRSRPQLNRIDHASSRTKSLPFARSACCLAISSSTSGRSWSVRETLIYPSPPFRSSRRKADGNNWSPSKSSGDQIKRCRSTSSSNNPSALNSEECSAIYCEGVS